MVIPKSRLFLKIMGSYLLLLLAALLIVDVAMVRRIHKNYVSQETNRLGTAALILSRTLPSESEAALLQNWVQEYGTRTGFRITLIDSSGKVLADNQFNPAQMDNHSNRPEISEAWQTGTGSSVRFSRTLGKNELYFARRAGQKVNAGLVLRLALPLQEISVGFSRRSEGIISGFSSSFSVGTAAGLFFHTVAGPAHRQNSGVLRKCGSRQLRGPRERNRPRRARQAFPFSERDCQ